MGPRPSSHLINSHNLTPFTQHYPFAQEGNIALYGIDDMGLMADIDRHCILEDEELKMLQIVGPH